MNYAERVPESAESIGTEAISPSNHDRGHIFIAGTGRSGTSFLVRYLTELGFDTHLSRRGKNASWDDAANAGLEDLAVPTSFEDLPYVVKSPWLYQHIGELVESNAVRIELVIIPVRNLVEAATSRSIVELRAVHQAAPWMAQFKKTWEHWALTPGGSVFSLNPLDQARLLAVGFHTLIENLIRADIPILFLEFPRLAEDGAYLFSKLRPWLPSSIQERLGLAAHHRVADPEKIRVRGETSAQNKNERTYSAFPLPSVAYDDQAVVDQLAIRRELERLRGAEVNQHAVLGEVERLRADLLATEGELARLREAEANLNRTVHERQRELERTQVMLAKASTMLDGVYASRSWKVTHPFRRVTEAVRALTGRK